MKTFKELTAEFVEAIKRKVVYRGGKRVVKKVTDKDGYKMVGGKEVKMSPKEKIARKKAGKIAARKRKGQSAAIAKKRARSMAKRK